MNDRSIFSRRRRATPSDYDQVALEIPSSWFVRSADCVWTRIALVFVSGVLACATWAITTASPAFAQTVTLNPSSGIPGTRVTVSGSGFPCNSIIRRGSVSFTLDGRRLNLDGLNISLPREDSVSFRGTFGIPSGTSPGPHAVNAVAEGTAIRSSSSSTSGSTVTSGSQTVPCGSATATLTVSPVSSSSPARASAPPRPSRGGAGFPVAAVAGGGAAIAIVALVLVAWASLRRRQEPTVPHPHEARAPRLRTIDDPGVQLVEPEADQPVVVVRAVLDPGEITLVDEEG